MNATAAALWCAVPLSVAVVIDALELLVDRRQLADGGLYGYAVLTTGRPVLLWGPAARPLGTVFRYPAVLSLPALQLGAAGILMAAAIGRSPGLQTAAGLAALTVFACRALLYLRNQLGLDGSDQMLLVASSAVAVCLLVPDHAAQDVALYYLAGQLLLAYAVAGIAKAMSPKWRGGDAIPGIMNTIGYGTPWLGAFLKRHHAAGLALCWSVIVFECTAPVLILAGTPGAVAIIVAGTSFHVGVALLMGLNGFLWTFAAAYPALIFLGEAIDKLWR